MKRFLIVLFSIPLLVAANIKLSPNAEIRVITCGPYQGELYSAFGHSAIYVKDSKTGVNVLYNYGVFDYEQPNFYLNFAKGHLNYRLATMDYDRFVASYISENRYVHEQVLNLNRNQTQRLYNFLQWNAQPENMYYSYDYFYDNCATRIRDAIKHVFADSISYDSLDFKSNHTIRGLCDLYLQEQPWGDLGIDLCLGLPMDKQATYWMHQFLPDYLESSLNDASIISGDVVAPLVRTTKLTYKPRPVEKAALWNKPVYWMLMVLLVGVLVSTKREQWGSINKWFDILLFGVSGFLGVFLIVLWFATDHSAAAYNYNILWAFPLHIVAAVLLVFNNGSQLLKRYFGFSTLLGVGLLASWAFLPQSLNLAFLPFTILLVIRSILQYRNG